MVPVVVIVAPVITLYVIAEYAELPPGPDPIAAASEASAELLTDSSVDRFVDKVEVVEVLLDILEVNEESALILCEVLVDNAVSREVTPLGLELLIAEANEESALALIEASVDTEAPPPVVPLIVPPVKNR